MHQSALAVVIEVKGTASIKMREIDPSHVRLVLPARW